MYERRGGTGGYCNREKESEGGDEPQCTRGEERQVGTVTGKRIAKVRTSLNVREERRDRWVL